MENNISQYLDRCIFNAKEVSTLLVGKPEILKCFVDYISSDNKDAWRASWVLAVYCVNNAKDLVLYADKIISALRVINGDGHLRETLKIILSLELSEEQTSDVFDFCMDILQDNKRQPSVRSIAFQFLIKVSEDYTELKGEIAAIFENIKDYLSPGIRHSMMIRLNR